MPNKVKQGVLMSGIISFTLLALIYWFARGPTECHPEEFLQGFRASEPPQIHYVLNCKYIVWAHTHICNLLCKLLFPISPTQYYCCGVYFLIPAWLYTHHPPGGSGCVQRPSSSLRCLSTLWVLPGVWWVTTSCQHHFMHSSLCIFNYTI